MSASPHNRQGLALVGTRGTGKSTVGRILAERLVRPFLDADVELEEKLGRSIAAIFAEDGEPLFRDWEEQVLSELTTAHPGAILATGGGVVLRESNRQALRSFGFVVWLWADPALAAARLQADRRGLDSRPALTPAGTHRRDCRRPRSEDAPVSGGRRRGRRHERSDRRRRWPTRSSNSGTRANRT